MDGPRTVAKVRPAMNSAACRVDDAPRPTRTPPATDSARWHDRVADETMRRAQLKACLSALLSYQFSAAEWVSHTVRMNAKALPRCIASARSLASSAFWLVKTTRSTRKSPGGTAGSASSSGPEW